jgi:hypothetical protein
MMRYERFIGLVFSGVDTFNARYTLYDANAGQKGFLKVFCGLLLRQY